MTNKDTVSRKLKKGPSEPKAGGCSWRADVGGLLSFTEVAENKSEGDAGGKLGV